MDGQFSERNRHEMMLWIGFDLVQSIKYLKGAVFFIGASAMGFFLIDRPKEWLARWAVLSLLLASGLVGAYFLKRLDDYLGHASRTIFRLGNDLDASSHNLEFLDDDEIPIEPIEP